MELGSQGAWMKWDLPKRKITWLELWRMREDPLCRLCGERGTMVHILAGCKIALSQRRYRWCHDKVLRALADILEQERQKKLQAHERPRPSIQFIREGEKPLSSTKRTTKGLLQTAQSWEMRVDLERKLHFPRSSKLP